MTNLEGVCTKRSADGAKFEPEYMIYDIMHNAQYRRITSYRVWTMKRTSQFGSHKGHWSVQFLDYTL